MMGVQRIQRHMLMCMHRESPETIISLRLLYGASMGSFLKIAQFINRASSHIAPDRHMCSFSPKSEWSSGTGMEKNEQQQQKIFYSFDFVSLPSSSTSQCARLSLAVVVMWSQPAYELLHETCEWINECERHIRRDVIKFKTVDAQRNNRDAITSRANLSSCRPINIFNRFNASIGSRNNESHSSREHSVIALT